MVDLREERSFKWEQHGLKVELRIADDLIELISDDGQAIKAPRDFWETVSSVIASCKPKKAPQKKVRREVADSTRPNQGQPWSPSLDEELRQMWETGGTARDLAAHFGRTTGGIASRLVKLGVVDSRDAVRARNAAPMETS
ncbi:hypothetical protein D3C71_153300 [compost metagenome]